MPGFVTSLGVPVICAHGGQAKAPTGMPRVKIMGQPAAVRAIPFVVSACVNPPPPVNVGPCVVGNWAVTALRIKAMGIPVLLQDSVAICVPTGTPLTQIPAQFRVRGM